MKLGYVALVLCSCSLLYAPGGEYKSFYGLPEQPAPEPKRKTEYAPFREEEISAQKNIERQQYEQQEQQARQETQAKAREQAQAQAQKQAKSDLTKKVEEAKKSLEPSKEYLKNISEEDLQKQLKDLLEKQFDRTKYTQEVQDAFPQIQATLEELNNLQEYKTPTSIRSNYQTSFARNVANTLLDTLVMVFDFLGLGKLRITALQSEKQRLETQQKDLTNKLSQGDNIIKWQKISDRLAEIDRSLATLQTNADYKKYIDQRQNFYKALNKAKAIAGKMKLFMYVFQTFNWEDLSDQTIRTYINWRDAAKRAPKLGQKIGDFNEFSVAVDAAIKARQDLRDVENKLIDSYTKNLNSYVASADQDFKNYVEEGKKTIESKVPFLSIAQQAADLKTELNGLIETINKDIQKQAAYNFGVSKYSFTESPYEILGVEKNASQKQIDDEYKIYADVFRLDKERFVKYQNAYDVLSKPNLRESVDRYETYLKQQLTDLTKEYDPEHLNDRLLKRVQDKTTATLKRLYDNDAKISALQISFDILRALQEDAQRKKQTAKEFESWSK